VLTPNGSTRRESGNGNQYDFPNNYDPTNSPKNSTFRQLYRQDSVASDFSPRKQNDSFFKKNDDTMIAELSQPVQGETPSQKLSRIFKLVLAKTKKRLQDKAKKGKIARGSTFRGAKGLKNMIFDLLQANKEVKASEEAKKDDKKKKVGDKQTKKAEKYLVRGKNLLKFNEWDVWTKMCGCTR